MRVQALLVVCLCVVALALGLLAAAGGVVALETPGPGRYAVGPATQRSVGVECAHPRALRLVRFEDGSAQLKCAEQILVRVSIPGR